MAQAELRQLSCLAGATSVTTTLSTSCPQRSNIHLSHTNISWISNNRKRETQEFVTVPSICLLHTIPTSFVMNHFPEAWGRVSYPMHMTLLDMLDPRTNDFM